MIPLFFIGGLTALTAYTYFGQNLVSAEEAKRLIKDGKIKWLLIYEQWSSTVLVTTPKHSTSQSIRLTKRPPQNSPREVYSSIATLGNGPDLQQRN